ncbi:MAG: 23S rRNA (adenine(2503)-C(2))-methyltransferase RlmN [Eggerthellaceae bacterium]|nr:23S rRNA (adenine(2503)-C(2))-methyltransferase RlmN [Eggerthellaceae bacterium]
MGQPHYRATQLFEWLYGHGARSYAEMTNLPGALRERLGAEAPFSFPEIIDKRVSADSTRKYILKLADGALVETVGIPSGGGAGDAGSAAKRLTVCFSTQVGCAMACTFCATGREGFVRNLFPGEMAWQVIAVADDFGMRVSNAVAMGQGEPFANYDHVLSALRILNHEKGLGIGARHITVSTCGIADRIRRFGSEAEQFTLAVSLHSAVQEVRNALMPGVAGTPLPALWDALRDYQERSGRRVTFEYLLAEGANSTDDALAALIDFCSGLSAHVNLLPVNAVDGSPLSPCPPERMGLWRARLERAGIEASVRTSRGADVFGACGQLKNARASS